MPGLETVPEHWRTPYGPYQQAPPDFGGLWWLVNPFTGLKPWETQGRPVEQEYPPRFIEVFGERPQVRHPDDRPALVTWEQNLKYFKQASDSGPEGEALDQGLFDFWGMGRGVFVEGRYGWSVRFPQAGYGAAVFTAVESPHLVIAGFQVQQMLKGEKPKKRHPFVPPHLGDEA